ncbi:ABC transporter permease [Dolichospermum sp. UHCC 0684]|jgi:peptide/nickel transport system permease protein|uniref:ABC transporter permease n=1 Tax=Dolichospermum flos-aquae CCAP 1403/13F TaxID=315271 RepID=A0A6H2BWB0_DOLFA|nr:MULTISPECIES: ABC transporter permease [Nostocales]MBO1053507.1 ABC transporter permease [Dolichospermum sp. DET73]MBS9385559.1 ABC transporter permease [Dolichospermum sp. BR01]MCE2698037.1 ABC transporter permease [Anabaena sp. 49633_E8]MDJ0503049.1 ABC transporter permease [Nostocales cyanobacterium LE14-WE4]OBQ03329.1 MAG: ABC transporter substrate-binding protein [Anabaena sp. LE011-02]OBQ34323.1 MAG: ABC transporter substrate-binding protein [Anabaena sp. MDT14b]QSV62821.1 MAG: ABC 
MTNTKISLDISRDWLIRRVTDETFIYVIKRLLQALLTIFLASALSFFIMKLSPGDYVDTLRQNPKISPERIEEIRRQFGLDKSWPQQFGFWLKQILTRGDFGTSFVYQRSVSSLLWERVPATLLLAIASLIITWAIAIPLGILAAVKQNRRTDQVLQIVSYAGQGIPSFITVLFLLFFAQLTTPLFPVGNMTSINHADLTWLGKILDIAWHSVLPLIALSITSFAGLQRIMRGQLLDVLRQDYIQTARAKGLPENRVIYVHALRNAINPLITLLGFELAGLLGGAFITENFFNWPGLGKLTLQAVLAKDQYLVMASLVMSAVLLIIGNLIADLILKAADPRIKLEDLN